MKWAQVALRWIWTIQWMKASSHWVEAPHQVQALHQALDVEWMGREEVVGGHACKDTLGNGSPVQTREKWPETIFSPVVLYYLLEPPKPTLKTGPHLKISKSHKNPHKTQYYAIQSKYLITVIKHAYRSQQDKIIERVKQLSASGNKAALAGDARCESPGKHGYYFYIGWVLKILNYTKMYFVSISLSGFSAKYCTYSFQGDATKEIR